MTGCAASFEMRFHNVEINPIFLNAMKPLNENKETISFKELPRPLTPLETQGWMSISLKE